MMQSEVSDKTLKAPAKLYRIGELVRRIRLSRQTIRNYTFMGLIQEAGFTDKGHSLYDESVFKKLSKIVEHKKIQKLPETTNLYRIGDLVRYCPSLSRQTIHNYTIMGLIEEAGYTEGGHRLYDESVFERLSSIVELKKTKTLSEIRQILKIQQTGGPNTGSAGGHGNN
jgi:DNA-binding transcriptional MerR regulator